MNTRIFIILSFLISLYSCDRAPKADFDLGDHTVYDPLDCIAEESRPQFLIDALNLPLLSIFKPDSVNHDLYKFDISFDEEAIRQHAIADFYIVDEKYNIIDSIEIICNNKKNIGGQFRIEAQQKDHIYIGINIPFELGDKEINGYIIADNANIDFINDTDLSKENVIGSFYASQEIKTNWIFWLLFLFVLIFLILFTVCIIKQLLIICTFSISYIYEEFLSLKESITSNIRKYKKRVENKHKTKKVKKKEEEKTVKDTELCAREALQKMEKLYSILTSGCNIQKRPGDMQKIEKRIKTLPEPWKSIMEEYNGSGETKKPAANRGLWSKTSDRNNSRWYPNTTEMPKAEGNDRNYNPKKWTLSRFLKEKGNREYIEFKNGYPNFKPFAYDTFDADVPIKMETNRDQLHKYLKTEILPRKWNCSANQVQQIIDKEKLTIHENTDGSFSLIHFSIHSSIEHHGGVSLCRIISRAPSILTIQNSKFIDTLSF